MRCGCYRVQQVINANGVLKCYVCRRPLEVDDDRGEEEEADGEREAQVPEGSHQGEGS